MGEMARPVQLTSDVLIVGGGGAGLCAAIEARKAGKDVLVVSRARVGYANNTFISAGAFSASGYGDAADSSRRHLADTIRGGRYINNPGLCENFVALAGDQLPFLESCGVVFSRRDQAVRVGLAPGHSIPRNVWARNSIGSDFMRPLAAFAREIGVRFVDNTTISRLFVNGERVCGAAGVSTSGHLVRIRAAAVILATGGFARIYENSNNAPGIFGSGHALAYERGVSLQDMEFVQFYPTAGTLYEVTVVRFGAKLRNAQNEDILEKHGMTDPAVITRDNLARAVFMEIDAGRDVAGGVVLDTRHIPEERLRRIQKLLPRKKAGSESPMVVGPTAHFCMGGVVVDPATMMTGAAGLFAAGEVCGGAHGANRLGGNALAEVFAMGRQAGIYASAYAGQHGPVTFPDALFVEEQNRFVSWSAGALTDIKFLRSSFKTVMWRFAGIARDHAGISHAISTILDIRQRLEHAAARSAMEMRQRLELEAMLTVGEAVCRAALLRKESRGAHFRKDFPAEDNADWLKNILVQKDGAMMQVTPLPVDRRLLSSLCIEPLRAQ